MSDEAPAPPAAERETVHTSVHEASDRRAETRRAFADAMAGDKPPPSLAPTEQPEPDEPAPAWLDPDVARMRRELVSEREALRRSPAGAKYDDLLDRPGDALRSWIEGMRGEGFANDDEFKSEAADLVSRLAGEVLGVPLPDSVRAKLDAANARKSVKHMRASDARRAADRAEQQAVEQEWSRATELVGQKLVAGSESAKAYPRLSAESNPGQKVVDVIRAAAEVGERLTWEAAAKLAESHLRRSERPAPAPPPAAKVPPSPPARREEPKQAARPQLETVRGKWSNEAHRARTLASLRQARSKPG